MKTIILIIVFNMPSGTPKVITTDVSSMVQCKAEIEIAKDRVVRTNVKGYSIRSAECLER